MTILAKHVMTKEVSTVDLNMRLMDLEQEFVEREVSGFPVLSDGKLVGVVSRSDLVLQLCVEHDIAELTSGFFDSVAGNNLPTADQVARHVGEEMDHLTVHDVMSHRVISVGPEDSLATVADMMTSCGVHRVLVTEQDQLLGVITSLDFVKLYDSDRIGEVKKPVHVMDF